MDDLLRAVSVLGRVERPHDSEVEPLLPSLTVEHMDSLLALISFHRVAPQFLLNLQLVPIFDVLNLDGVSHIKDRLQEILGRQLIIASSRNSEIGKLLRATNGIPLIMIKGVYFVRKYQPEHGLRLTSDIDVFVPTEWLWETVSAATQLGYDLEKVRFDYYRVRNSDPHQKSGYGICPTVKIAQGSAGYEHSIDIHFGTFPGCGPGYVDVHGNKSTEDQTPLEPSYEDAILVLLAHTSRAGYCRMRDINDLYVILSKDVVDFEELDQKVSEAHLGEVLQALLYAAIWVYPNLSSFIPDNLADRWVKRNVQLMFGRRQQMTGPPAVVTTSTSRLLQCRYLWKWVSANYSPIRSAAWMVQSAVRLRKSDRPYRVWEKRQIKRFLRDEHVVMCPLVYFSKYIDYSDLCERKDKLDVSIDWIDTYGIGVMSRGTPHEIILTPSGIFTQCGYAGERGDIPNLSSKLAAVLAQLEIEDYRWAPSLT